MMHLEVRKKIVEARKNGLKVKEICRAYSVGKSAVYDLLRRERETGNIEPQTHKRGRKPTLSSDDLAAIEHLLQTQNDITVAEIQETLELTLCESAIRTIIRDKLGYRYKKRQYMPVSETELM